MRVPRLASGMLLLLGGLGRSRSRVAVCGADARSALGGSTRALRFCDERHAQLPACRAAAMGRVNRSVAPEDKARRLRVHSRWKACPVITTTSESTRSIEY